MHDGQFPFPTVLSPTTPEAITDPEPSWTSQEISLGYEPPFQLANSIKSPEDALKFIEPAEPLERVAPLITVTPLTTKSTLAPPFQPSPQLSYILKTWLHWDLT